VDLKKVAMNHRKDLIIRASGLSIETEPK